MAKRIILYSLIFSVILLCIFFLFYFSQGSIVFNILGPVEQFPKKEVIVHLYGNEQVSINKVLVRMYYGVMGGGLTRKLKDNYLKKQLKEKMMD